MDVKTINWTLSKQKLIIHVKKKTERKVRDAKTVWVAGKFWRLFSSPSPLKGDITSITLNKYRLI